MVAVASASSRKRRSPFKSMVPAAPTPCSTYTWDPRMYATCAGQHTVDTKYWPHQQTPSFICTPHKLPAADYDFADSPLQTIALAHCERDERALPAR